MADLTSTQRKHLRGLAHSLQPIVRVGQKGLSASVFDEVDQALDAHELIKVKLSGDRDERQRDAEELAARTRSHLAGTIGTVAILYRRQADPEKRKIRLS